MNTQTDHPAWLPLSQVAKWMGVSPHLCLHSCRAGHLPIRTTQFGERGQWFCANADVLAYLKKFTGEAK